MSQKKFFLHIEAVEAEEGKATGLVQAEVDAPAEMMIQVLADIFTKNPPLLIMFKAAIAYMELKDEDEDDSEE